MKSVFITFDQAFYERILALLDRQNCRGFSYWQQLQGRGSVKGELLTSRQTSRLDLLYQF